MAATQPDMEICPRCSSRDVGVVSRTEHLRPRPQTGNLRTDLTPVSTTVKYRCKDPNCGHEWSESKPL
jgi:hypothetical protein